MSRTFLFPATAKKCKTGLSVFGSAALIVTGVAATTPSYATEKPASPAAVAAPQTEASDNNPIYETTKAPQQQTTTVKAPLNADGSALPANTTFSEGADFPDWATLNTDGSITVNPTDTTSITNYNVTVVAHFSDGSDKQIRVQINVTAPQGPTTDADDIHPVYRPITVDQGTTQTTDTPGSLNDLPIPQGTTYTLVESVPSWITLNANGSVTASPGTDVATGSYPVKVLLHYPDSSLEDTEVTIYVRVAGSNNGKTYADTTNPSWTNGIIEAGSTTVLTYTGDQQPVGTLTAVKGDSGWGAVWGSEGPIITAPQWAKPGQVGNVTFTVIYADNSEEVVTSQVRVIGPGWNDAAIKPGQTLTQANIGDAIKADDTVNVSFPNNPGWTGSVDTDGNLVVTAPSTAKDGEVGHAIVEITHATGGTAKMDIAFTVSDPTQQRLFQPVYADTTVQQDSSQTATVTEANGKAFPAGTTFTLGTNAPTWASIADDGTLTFAPNTSVAPGDYSVPVTAVYPDGTIDNVSAKVTVTAKPVPVSHGYSPEYADTTVQQGTTKTVAVAEKSGKEFPATATFAAGKTTPAWATVAADGTITVKPGTDVKPGDYAVPVTITYADGSTNAVTAKVTVTAKPAPVADSYAPSYSDTTVEQGSTKSVAVTIEDGKTLPATTKFALGAEAPAWVSIADDGTVIAKPGTDVKPGGYNVPVTVTYADGTTDAVTAKVTVTAKPASNTVYAPSWESGTVKPGETITLKYTGTPLEERATAETTYPSNWKVSLNDDDAYVVTAPSDAKDGDKLVLDITVTYADGTVDTTQATVTVKADAAAETPAPVETTPAPVETTPAPVETTPAPVETTPEPVETTPSPVETPSPAESEQPTPVETPAPAETTKSEQPAPVETTEPAAPAQPEPAQPAPAETTQVAAPIAPAPSSPAPVVEQQPEQPALAYTGAAGVGVLSGLGALALLAGGALVAARRRHS